jgi:hypothetical protein
MQPQTMEINAVLPAGLREADLDQQLANALAASKAAAEKAFAAQQNLKRADDLLSDAESRVFRLQGEFKKTEQLAVAGVADAIRAGSPLPTFAAPEIGQAELSAAKAKAASIRGAYEVLDTEYRTATAEATKAAAAVEKLSPGPNRLERAATTLAWTLGWGLGIFLLLFALALSLASL